MFRMNQMMSKPIGSRGASQLQIRSSPQGSKGPQGPQGPQGSSLANQGGFSQPQRPPMQAQRGASQAQNKARGTASSSVRSIIK